VNYTHRLGRGEAALADEASVTYTHIDSAGTKPRCRGEASVNYTHRLGRDEAALAGEALVNYTHRLGGIETALSRRSLGELHTSARPGQSRAVEAKPQ